MAGPLLEATVMRRVGSKRWQYSRIVAAMRVPLSFHSMPHSSLPTLQRMMHGWLRSRSIIRFSRRVCSSLTPVRRFSSITRMPRLSQASSISGVIGLWEERQALQPNFFSSFSRYTCRASGMPAPTPGWSWCMFTPFSFRGCPFRRKPLSASKRMSRIPIGVATTSTCLPFCQTLVSIL